MFRLSRHLTVALLWIAVALLPVRGLAAVMMPMMMAGMQSAAMVSAPAVHEAAVEMPCHAASEVAAISSGSTASTCSMCDLCHTTAAQAATMSVTLPELHEVLPPAMAPPAIEPRAPDGLFRPPRTTLA